jgi:cobalt-zinc-cadmium efflux system membrane fusion protein
MKTQFLLIALVLVGGAFAGRAILKTDSAANAETGHHDHDEPHSDSDHHHCASAKTIPEEGPHGGKLLRGVGFELEVTIFETDTPPEFRVFGYRNGQPLAPTDFTVVIELQRLGDRTDSFAFRPDGTFQRGEGVVREPHSFDVVVRADHGGKSQQWIYESYEGRTRIEPAMAERSGIKVAAAGPTTLRETIKLHGLIKPDANRVAKVGARFPGWVKEVRKQLGDPIESGDVLAIVESNESLQAYEVKAPHAGIITERNVTVGSVTADGALFVVTDHSSVWVDLNVLSTDANKVKAGLPVVVQTVDGSQSVELTLPEFLPGAVVESQTRVIRLQLDNRDGRWTPGLRVIATVTLPPHEVRVGVQSTGLQSFRDWTVVFAQVADTYEVRMLELGRSDGEHVEVLGGLEAGERYVTHNSFLVKADAMKSGASHDH